MENIIIPNKDLFPRINPSLIYTSAFIDKKEYLFESEKNEITKEGEKKMSKIINILLRFCSYHNDLGDIFSIGEKDQIVNYDLTKKQYPFTVNICCIGRFGKGKSTCVNCLLGERKAKESKSGASTTKKISYYQISDQPIKIYDIPGFESEETADNAVKLLKELNNEIDESKQLHFILYIIKSTDERMFSDLEFDMILEITKQKNLKLLYILTHSTKNINKKEIVDRINVGIKNILQNHEKKIDNFDKTFLKIKADRTNCIFVNFHQEENNPIYGINELFLKLGSLVNEIKINKEIIYKFQENKTKNSLNDNQNEFVLFEQASDYLFSRAKTEYQPQNKYIN